MSESNPPNGLTDAERARMEERLANLLAEIERLQALAKMVVAELAADEAAKRQRPGRVFRFPAPDDDGPTDQGSL